MHNTTVDENNTDVDIDKKEESNSKIENETNSEPKGITSDESNSKIENETKQCI